MTVSQNSPYATYVQTKVLNMAYDILLDQKINTTYNQYQLYLTQHMVLRCKYVLKLHDANYYKMTKLTSGLKNSKLLTGLQSEMK
jgi:hypothetical protein